jgi:hypothetical protein
MSQILSRIKSFLRIDRTRRGFKRQGGYVVIALAAIGLFGGIAAAAPVLNRAVGSLKANDASPSNEGGARAAAEHAMWRLKNDYALWSGMTGEPPTTGYTFTVAGSGEDAQIDIIALSAPPGNPFTVELTSTPDIVSGGGTVTYTLTVTNNGVEAHQLERITAYTIGWAPEIVNNSSSINGQAINNPSRTTSTSCFVLVQTDCKYTWSLVTPVSISPFGGELLMTWQARVWQFSGTHILPVTVDIVNEGTFPAIEAARVTVGSDSGLTVEEFVTPNERSAGVNTVYDYTVRVSNNGDEDLTLEWIRHWSTPQLIYKEGTAEFNGNPIGDPEETKGGFFYQLAVFLYELLSYDSRDRYQWYVPTTVITPGEHVDLTFQMEGGLTPGIYYSRGSALVEEAPGGNFLGLLELSTTSSGETAQITISQGFTITAVHDGQTVIVSGYIMPDGIDILSWKEF